MIPFIISSWAVVTVATVGAIWHLSRTTRYVGRHRPGLDGLSTMESPRAGVSLAAHIDVLTMPVHTCALPPAPGAKVYELLGELAHRRLTVAQRAMRRRSQLARAGAWPTGEFGQVA